MVDWALVKGITHLTPSVSGMINNFFHRNRITADLGKSLELLSIVAAISLSPSERRFGGMLSRPVLNGGLIVRVTGITSES